MATTGLGHTPKSKRTESLPGGIKGKLGQTLPAGMFAISTRSCKPGGAKPNTRP
jgi:hypothetical protein